MHTRLLSHIESRLGWVPATEWSGAHFERLAAEIGDATGVHLSVTTLKRVWGHVAYRSQPSITTLDALARFGGFEDWVSAQAGLRGVEQAPWKESLDGPGGPVGPDARREEASNLIEHEKSIRAQHRGVSPALLGVGAAIVCIVLASAMARRFAEPYAGPPPAAVRFDFAPLTEGVPNTVQFRYAIAGAYDSVQIQQSWDERLRHRVDPGRDFFACTYFYPGAYRAKLLADTHVVAERPLVVPSGGWLGIIGPSEHASPPAYVRGGDLEVAPEVYRIAPSQPLPPNHEASISYIVASPGLSGDDGFTLRTSFRSLGEDVCQRTQLVVFGEQGTIVLPFSLPGCTGELYAYACGQEFDGTEVDLSGFGVSPAEATDVKVELNDSMLSVHVSGALAFRQNLSRLPGNIVGARWTWPGSGEVHQFTVQ